MALSEKGTLGFGAPTDPRHAMTTLTETPFRRAVVLVTLFSFMASAAGVLIQPILARALGAAGRGELTAAMAPAALALAVATLGLPEALTYYLAKYPRLTRPALLSATLATTALGLACLVVAYLFVPFLSIGSAQLGGFILLGMALTIPILVVGVLRGAAAGRQMWGAIALERLLNAVVRIVAFVLLFLLGHLTVYTAVLVTCFPPMLAGLVYLRLLRRPPPDDVESPGTRALQSLLLRYGGRVWFGSVASMLLARSAQLLMAPLSSVTDLGLFSVASTISDLPLLVALAIAGALHGVNSRSTNPDQVTTTARVTLLVGFVGCLVLGATLPFWLAPLFGSEFGAALAPTWLLLVSAVICIPGMMAGTGMAAWGRPGRRSIGIGVTLLVNIVMFVALVPTFGVIGGCVTSIVSNLVMTTFMVVSAARVLDRPVASFLVPRVSDVVLAGQETRYVLGRLVDRLPGARAGRGRSD